MKKCPICGSTKIDAGTVAGYAGVRYASNNDKRLFKLMYENPNAFVCLDCGFLGVFLNTQKLKETIGK